MYVYDKLCDMYKLITVVLLPYCVYEQAAYRTFSPACITTPTSNSNEIYTETSDHTLTVRV